MAAYWPLPDESPTDWSADAERCNVLLVPAAMFVGDTFDSVK